jgi:hypothetical protein
MRPNRHAPDLAFAQRNATRSVKRVMRHVRLTDGQPTTEKGSVNMKSLKVFIYVLVVGCLLFATESFVQARMQSIGSSGWGTGTPYARMYDPKTMETISGEVKKVETFNPMTGMGPGIHLLLKTDKETISVHLGPAWYIEKQDIQIEEKDHIEVRGSRILYQKQPAIIAAEVKKGNNMLKLRDDNGIPVWSGWRRRQ